MQESLKVFRLNSPFNAALHNLRNDICCRVWVKGLMTLDLIEAKDCPIFTKDWRGLVSIRCHSLANNICYILVLSPLAWEGCLVHLLKFLKKPILKEYTTSLMRLKFVNVIHVSYPLSVCQFTISPKGSLVAPAVTIGFASQVASTDNHRRRLGPLAWLHR